MSASRLLVGLASVFAGLTVVLAVLGFVYSPVALAIAVPFGVVTYVLWYHVSGRLENRVREHARRSRARPTGEGGFDAGFGSGANRRGGRQRGRRTGRARRPERRTDGPTTAEAYRVLDLDPGASQSAVRSAYREKVKQVHPDTKDGDERRFRRVNEAYEQLTSGNA